MACTASKRGCTCTHSGSLDLVTEDHESYQKILESFLYTKQIQHLFRWIDGYVDQMNYGLSTITKKCYPVKCETRTLCVGHVLEVFVPTD